MSKYEMIEVKGMHPPKTKQGLEKIQLLLQSAEKLFAEQGFFAVSVSDICKAAHTAVGTFYIYFDSKLDMYRYLVEHYQHKLKHTLSRSIGNGSALPVGAITSLLGAPFFLWVIFSGKENHR